MLILQKMPDNINGNTTTNSGGEIKIPIVAEPIGHLNPFTDSLLDSIILTFPDSFDITISYKKSDNNQNISIKTKREDTSLNTFVKRLNDVLQNYDTNEETDRDVKNFFATLKQYELVIECYLPPVSGLRILVLVAFGIVKAYLKIKNVNKEQEKSEINNLYELLKKITEKFKEELEKEVNLKSGQIMEAIKTNKTFLIPSVFKFLQHKYDDLIKDPRTRPYFWKIENGAKNEDPNIKPLRSLNNLIDEKQIYIYLIGINSFMHEGDFIGLGKNELQGIQKCCTDLLKVSNDTYETSGNPNNHKTSLITPFAMNYWSIIRNSMAFGYTENDKEHKLPVVYLFDIFNFHHSAMFPLKITKKATEKEDSKPFALLITAEKIEKEEETHKKNLFNSFRKYAYKRFKSIYENKKIEKDKFDKLFNNIFGKIVDLNNKDSINEFISLLEIPDNTVQLIFNNNEITVKSNKGEFSVSYAGEADRCLFLHVLKKDLEAKKDEVTFDKQTIENAMKEMNVSDPNTIANLPEEIINDENFVRHYVYDWLNKKDILKGKNILKYKRNLGSSPCQVDDLNITNFQKEYSKGTHVLIDDVLKNHKVDINNISTITPKQLTDAFNELINIPNFQKLIEKKKGLSGASREAVNKKNINKKIICENKQKLISIYPGTLEKSHKLIINKNYTFILVNNKK